MATAKQVVTEMQNVKASASRIITTVNAIEKIRKTGKGNLRKAHTKYETAYYEFLREFSDTVDTMRSYAEAQE